MALEKVQIIIRGKHDTGRTTIASFIRTFLVEEGGFMDVRIVPDTPPLPPEQKERFAARLERTRMRPVEIYVELEE